MKLFGRSDEKSAQQTSEAGPAETTRRERRPGEAKGRPTPTRRQAEAERRRRLQLSPKERKKQAREAERRARMEAYEARDRTPEKELLRDVVDSRWSLAEFVLPILLLNLAASIMWPNHTNPIAYVMYSYILLSIIDGVLCWRRYRALLRERMPRLTDISGLGLRFYLFNRVISLRPMRNPKPRVRRGEKI